MDVGTTLRTAREQRGRSVADLASTTKIPAGLLVAIENNTFDRVPRGIFVRGYLRAYAREVGLEPDAVIEQFLAETGETLPVSPPVPTAEPEVDETIDAKADHDISESGPGWGYVLVVAALLVAIVSFNRNDAAEPPVVSQTPQVVGAVDVHPAAVEIEPVGTAGKALRFELAASGPCWVEAVVDGRRVVYRLMQPGERESIDGDRDIVLRIGDPGAVSYVLNGQAGQPLGSPGIPVTIRFSSSGEPEVAS
jgi:hypothetical protein